MVIFEGCMIDRNGGDSGPNEIWDVGTLLRGPMKRHITYMPRVFLRWLGVFFDCFPKSNAGLLPETTHSTN